MPTFQMYDPLTAGSEAAGAFIQARRQSQKDKAANDRQTKQDALAEQHWQGEQGVRQGQLEVAQGGLANQTRTTDSTIKRTDAEIANMTHEQKIQDANLVMAQAREAAQVKMDGLNLQIKQGEIDKQKSDAAAKKIEDDLAAFKAGIEKKYGVRLAEQQLAQGAATLAGTKATTANTLASTDETRARTGLIGAETVNVRNGVGIGGTGGGAAGKMSNPDKLKLAKLKADMTTAKSYNSRILAMVNKHDLGGELTPDQQDAQASKVKGYKNLGPIQKQIDSIYAKYGATDPDIDPAATPAATPATPAASNNNASTPTDTQAGPDQFQSQVNGIVQAIKTKQGTLQQAINSIRLNNPNPVSQQRLIDAVVRGVQGK